MYRLLRDITPQFIRYFITAALIRAKGGFLKTIFSGLRNRDGSTSRINDLIRLFQPGGGEKCCDVCFDLDYYGIEAACSGTS